MKSGRFITLEGGEGTGKSTLLQGLLNSLKRHGVECTVTREPGGTPLAEAIRDLVLNAPGENDWQPLSRALLMNAARQDHLETLIKPELKKGRWVLCDRFADSTRVYQGMEGLGSPVIRALEDLVVGTGRPDLTLILDAAPEDVISRREQRGTQDVFEGKEIDFHKGVREAFLDIAKAEPERCIVLDAMQSPDDVLNAAMKAITDRLIHD